MLKSRIMTALVLLPIAVLCILFLPAILFMVLTAVVLMWGAWEWSVLMGLEGTKPRTKYLLVMAIAFLLASLIGPRSILFVAVLWWVGSFYWVYRYPKSSRSWAKRPYVIGAMGILTLVPCWVGLNFLRVHPHRGTLLLLLFFVLIWSMDTGAYFVGRRFGKHKLAPHVSPGKTVEGLLGGLVLSMTVALVVSLALRFSLAVSLEAILLTFVMGFFSVQGDLLESMLKREANLKDSGHILPGHGGLLDRLDSLTAATPVFVFGAIYLWM